MLNQLHLIGLSLPLLRVETKRYLQSSKLELSISQSVLDTARLKRKVAFSGSRLSKPMGALLALIWR
jgi:hypothetical protein